MDGIDVIPTGPGSPVKDIFVTAMNTTNGSVGGRVLTDPAGNYVLNNLQPVQYLLFAELPNYNGETCVKVPVSLKYNFNTSKVEIIVQLNP